MILPLALNPVGAPNPFICTKLKPHAIRQQPRKGDNHEESNGSYDRIAAIGREWNSSG